VRDKIIGDGGEDALKDVGRVAVSFGLKVGLAEEAIGIEMARVGLGYGARNRPSSCPCLMASSIST
jgi:hypothetical protein